MMKKKISAHTSKEMHSFMSVIGTNGVLKVRGKNDVTVQRFITTDYVDLVEGYKFGDLSSGNIKQFLVELEVSPKK